MMSAASPIWRKQVDEVTGLSTLVVIDPKRRGSTKVVRPQVKLLDAAGQEVKIPGTDHSVTIGFSIGSLIQVRDGQELAPGEVLARIPVEGQKTRDITGGLPRVAELFEARTPKDKGAKGGCFAPPPSRGRVGGGWGNTINCICSTIQTHPHPGPDETTSHSTKLTNNVSKSLVIPLKGTELQQSSPSSHDRCISQTFGVPRHSLGFT